MNTRNRVGDKTPCPLAVRLASVHAPCSGGVGSVLWLIYSSGTDRSTCIRVQQHSGAALV